MRKIALALLVALLHPCGALADFQAALSQYQRQNYRAALAEFETLSDAGESDAQYMLGKMYAEGKGILQDYVQAHKWYNLASANGRRDAARARDQVQARMTPSQVERAQQLARDWMAAAPRTRTARPAPAATRAPAPAPSGPGRATIAGIQSMLSDLGYDPGPADGLPGRRTRSAIEQYQRSQGLFPDGEPSDELSDELRASLTRKPAPSAPAPVAAAPPPEPVSPPGRYGAATSASPASVRPAWIDDPQGQQKIQELIRRVRTMSADARRYSAADPGLLTRIDALTGRFDWPWTRVVIEDQFTDRDFRANPAWQVGSGSFDVDATSALRSRVDANPVPDVTQPRSGESQALALLGTLMQQQEPQTPSAKKVLRGDAAIHVPARVSSAFAVRVGLVSHGRSGHAEWGLYRDAGQRTGYRLVYDSTGRDGIVLVRRTAGGNTRIGASGRRVGLEDGQVHHLSWTRDPDGAMAVFLDEALLFTASERPAGGSFIGFSFTNRGGDIGLAEVTVLGIP